jgi:chemotaxis signal transduction protein
MTAALSSVENRLRCLACEKQGYLLAVDLADIAEVQRPTSGRPETQLVLLGGNGNGPRFASVDRVFGVLDADTVLPVPSCLRRQQDGLSGVLHWRGNYYLRVSPEMLLNFREIRLESAQPCLHEESEGAEASDALISFTIPCAGDPALPLIGVSGRQVLEIQNYAEPASAPASSGRLRGLAPWRGSIVPMIDLSLALGYAQTDLSRVKRTLILRCSGRHDALAIPVSAQISRSVRLEEFRRMAIPEHATQAAIRGAFVSGGRELIVPDLDALI